MRLFNSIGLLVSALGGLLGALLIAIAASNAYSEWRNYLTAQSAQQVNAAADHLLVAIERLTLERGLTNSALNSEAPVAAAAREAILQRRGQMREAQAAGWPVLTGLDYLAAQGLIGKAESAMAAIDALRAQADQTIGKPRGERDPAVQQAWYPTMTGGIEALMEVWLATSQRLSAIDAEVASFNAIKRLSGAMREFTGRERALLGLGRPLDAGKQLEVADWRGRAEQAWEQLNSVFPKELAPPAVAAALANTRERFFGKYLPVRDQVYQNLVAGKPSGLAGKEWSDISNPALNAIVAIRDGAISAGAAHLDARVSSLQNAMSRDLGMSLVALMLTLAVLVIARSRVSAPLMKIAKALEGIAGGRFDVEVPAAARSDEIGAIASAVAAFRDQSLRVKEIERERAELERQATEGRRADMNRIAQEFQAAVGAVVDAVSSASRELESAATSLTGAAESTKTLSETVYTASGQASANVGSVAAAAEQLGGSVQEIARQVQESSRIAGSAVEQARRTDLRIAELSDAAARIGDVVNLITAIAGQTNLLALNATIEAARAGEAGKGFAVVAQEVKALAAQTAKATEEIGTQISGIQAATQDSVAAMKEIGTTINRISEIAVTISAAVEEQGNATGEISRSIHQAAEGTGLVASSIADVNNAATKTGAVSSQVLAAAQSLAGDGERLKSEVERFLGSVRAA